MGISLKSSHLEQRINPDGAFRIFCHANCLKRYVAVLTSRVRRTKHLVQHARIIHMPWVHLLCGDWGHEGDRERTGNDFLMIENLSCPACNSQFTCPACNSQFTCPACDSQFTCPACNSQFTCPASFPHLFMAVFTATVCFPAVAIKTAMKRLGNRSDKIKKTLLAGYLFADEKIQQL